MEPTIATFSAELWESDAGSWVFVTLPADVSRDIREAPRPPQPGFGSVRVEVTIGGSSWATSVFPDSKRGAYLLPVKKAVRVAEGVEPGDVVEVTITTLD